MKQRAFEITGAVLAILNALNVLNSTWYFLGRAHFPVTAWLAFNACAPSVGLYLVGYIWKNEWLMAMAIPPMLYFGTGGLFVFGWSGTALFAQVGHILMTLAVAWLAARCFVVSDADLRARLLRIVPGFLLACLVVPIQRCYVGAHPEFLSRLGDSTYQEHARRDVQHR
jgi:hypothetical protein